MAFGRFDSGFSGEPCKGNQNERQYCYTLLYIVRLTSRSGCIVQLLSQNTSGQEAVGLIREFEIVKVSVALQI